MHLVETGLQLQTGTGSYPSFPSHSIDKLPYMTYFLVGGRGKHTGKNDLTRCVTHRQAVFGMVIHSIIDKWHYECPVDLHVD
jgi:hypothetical protein